jgi:uncharacterized protein YndB with AHSA1/START domain
MNARSNAERPGPATAPESERELTITRVFAVPARILFLACSRPEHMTQWFGPKGFPLTLCEMDFRVGGKYRFAMSGPDGKQMTPFSGEYLVIEQDRKIAYTSAFDLEGAEMAIVTLSFTEEEGQTTLVLHTLFGSVAMKQLHVGMGYAGGVGSGLDQLAELAARLERA